MTFSAHPADLATNLLQLLHSVCLIFLAKSLANIKASSPSNVVFIHPCRGLEPSRNLVHHPQPAATGQAIQHTKMGISIKQKLANGRKIESKQPNLLLVMKFGFLLEKLPRSRCSPLQQCRVAFLTYIHLLFAIAAHVQNHKGDGKGKNVLPNMLHIFQGSVMLWQHCASSTASPLGIHLRPEMPWKYL